MKNSYVIYSCSDDEFFKRFKADSDDAAFDFLETFVCVFGDRLEDYKLFRILEV